MRGCCSTGGASFKTDGRQQLQGRDTHCTDRYNNVWHLKQVFIHGICTAIESMAKPARRFHDAVQVCCADEDPTIGSQGLIRFSGKSTRDMPPIAVDDLSISASD